MKVIKLFLVLMVLAHHYGYCQTIDVSKHKVIGNENIDNTEQLNALFNSVRANSTIFFPKGKYKISGNLNVKKAIIITGQDAVFVGVGALKAVAPIKLSNMKFEGVFVFLSSSNSSVINCDFNNITGNAINVSASEASPMKNIEILNNTFFKIYPTTLALINSTGRAVYIASSSKIENLNFSKNTMSLIYGGSAFFARGLLTGFKIYNNSINKISGQGIEFFKVSPLSTGIVDNNKIRMCGSLRAEQNIKSGVGCNGIFASVLNGGNLNDVSITNNNIDSVLENGIEGPFGLVKGNTVSNTGYNMVDFPTPSPEGIFGGLNIIDNKIINPYGHGIYIFKTKQAISDRIIKNNTIRSFTKRKSYSGICLNSSAVSVMNLNITIDSNSIDNFETAISLPHSGKSSGLNIRSNKFIKCDKFIKNTNQTKLFMKLNKVE
ncbi:hypothetical protein [Pedobacter psychrodurus]|uniref:hypothetical protein n=1 Tax=Pedobacter psychrodurus TaxID=2530456 RepID=UPI00292E9B87|nr:hypothetical protein [Pedobacter psychrodurus]